MIYDTMENIGFYKGMNANLDKAIEYLKTADLAALSNGRHDVDGDNVYVQVMDTELKPASELRYEMHREYCDIQISVKGGELIGWVPSASLKQWGEYTPDIVFADDKVETDTKVELKSGRFVMLFPQDAHCPGEGSGIDHKIVVKVKL